MGFGVNAAFDRVQAKAALAWRTRSGAPASLTVGAARSPTLLVSAELGFEETHQSAMPCRPRFEVGYVKGYVTGYVMGSMPLRCVQRFGFVDCGSRPQ